MAGSNAETDNMSPIVAYDSEVVILDTAQQSNSVDILGNTLVSVIIPSNFIGTAITFEASVDNITFFTMHTPCEPLDIINIVPSIWVGVPPADFASARYIRLTSDLVQTSDTTIILGVRPL